VANPGIATTYDLTIGVIVDIEDMIHMISPFDVPLQGQQGADGSTAVSMGTCFEKKVEWLDEEILTPKSSLAANATTGQTTLTVAAGHQLRFSTGDVVLVKNSTNERLLVTDYNSTNQIVVTRAFSTTTADNIATGVSLLVLGQALPEGSDPEEARAVDRGIRDNVTQIFGPTQVSVSGTENVVRKYGLSGTTEFDHQAGNRTKEQYIQIEQAVLYGKKFESSPRRTMGGLTEYITTLNNTSSTQLTETNLLDQLQNAFDNGGSPDRLVVGAKQKRFASNNWTTALTLNATRVEAGRGYVVEYFDSDFGRISVLLDRWVNTSDAFGFSRDQVELTTLRPMQFEMLAKTGDSIKGQILCEKTAKVRRQQHAFRFSALT